MSWIKVIENGLKNQFWCAHATEIVDGKLFIFGGYSSQKYANADIYILEMDQHKIKKLEKDQNISSQRNLLNTQDLHNCNFLS